MGDSDIVKHLKDLESEGKNLKLELMKICWFMRGGMSWQETLNLSPDERSSGATSKREHGHHQKDRSTFLLEYSILLWCAKNQIITGHYVD